MKNGRLKFIRVFALAALVSSLSLAIVTPRSAVTITHAKSAAEERAARIESALFTRAEFFGAQAIIPYPTAEARARLAEVRRPERRLVQGGGRSQASLEASEPAAVRAIQELHGGKRVPDREGQTRGLS